MSYSDVLNARKAALQARLEQTDWNSDVISELAEVEGAIGSAGGGGASQSEIQAAIEAASNLDGLEGSLSAIVTNTADIEALLGAVTEAAPANDTASSGLNGRLQRIAQRITSLIALLPASLGAKTAANSFSVTLSTDGTAATRWGSNGDAASLTGSQAAQLREIGNRLINTTTTYTHPTPVSVTNISTQVVASNSSRKHLIIVNRSTTLCYLQFGATATTNGIPLNPATISGQGGGTYEMTYSNLFTGAINAITSSGTATLSVMEGV